MSVDIDIETENEKWAKSEMEKARTEFANRLESIIEQLMEREFGALGKNIARDVIVNVSIEMKHD